MVVTPLVKRRQQVHFRWCAGCVARIALVVVHSMAADDIAVEVHCDHHVGTKRTANGHGMGIQRRERRNWSETMIWRPARERLTRINVVSLLPS